ncbi:hypothetical protein FKW77_003367 [Venturia effusa]|uniref:Uncharacterized protein n=1 Tax=Venturia effusa TaxID=50376 RepID=A0A517LFB4_9PEZI|nr:hypothetical protein FKW77_003367 [Venturia effusa]
MTQPTQKPTSFLSLSRELRQRILNMTITERHFHQDVKFNVALQVYDNNIMANILAHTFGTRIQTLNAPGSVPKVDEEAFSNFHTAYKNLRAYGIIPVHIIQHAETLAAVHPLVKQDMSWILKKWLEKLFAMMLVADPVPKTRRRRQSIYVLEPFGSRRRVDKFTAGGARSYDAVRRGFRKAYERSMEVWVFDG